MKISLENPARVLLVRRCAAGEVQIGDTVHRRSLVVAADRLLADWGASDVAALDDAAIAAIDGFEPEIVLLGTGVKQVFPPPALFAHFATRRIGFEVMDNGAACRTYNVLVSEGRRAVCALILAP